MIKILKPLFYTIGYFLRVFDIPARVGGLKIRFPDNMKLEDLGASFTDSYEKDERILVKKYLKETDSVLELGACVGVVSLTINGLLANKSKQVSIEPNPEMHPYLQKNKEANRGEFSFEKCIVSTDSEVEFSLGGTAFLSSSTFGKSNLVKIEGKTLSKLEMEYFPFTALVMDIEGGELAFYRSFDLSDSSIDTIIYETHVSSTMLTVGELEECHTLLKSYGFTHAETSGKVEAWIRQ